MKKVFLFFAVALFFASCAPKAAEEAAPVEEAVIEEVVEATDSVVTEVEEAVEAVEEVVAQ